MLAARETCHGRALLPLTRGHRPPAGFGVLTVSVQAKKGLVTKTDRQAFLADDVSDEPPVGSPRGRPP